MKKETKMARASRTPKSGIEEFLCAFDAFKQTNDQRLAQIEKKQSADVLTEEKLTRIDAAMGEQKSAMDRMRLSQARPGLELKPATDTANVHPAWDRYMRQGDASKLTELKALSSGIDADGGYVAPDETQTQIDRLLAESSPIRAIASVRQTSSGLLRKPVSQGGAASGWVSESAARPETNSPTLDLIEFPMAELYAMPATTQTLLDDAVVNVDQWLAEEVRDVLAAQETTAFVTGNGSSQPKGFLSYTNVDDSIQSWGEMGYVATGTDGGFDASNPMDAILDLIYAPKSVYRPNASFVMNRRTVSAVRKFKDADGNYIWQAGSGAGQPSSLLGYPISEVEDMPDIATDAFSMAFGDFRRGYLIVDRAGINVVRDPYSAKPFVLFYTTKRVGGGVQDFNAIKLLKFAVS
ncbi:Gene Transfer Agent capsid protein; Phage major capsid protein [hydrothermal vent metagenome]|uniref:Gene Transfer Agent capsid protein Phage major capsid protein n=1 Tax=hydrothermal vent metagenome TaxID=652676 RepID=A0A3B0S7E1_9ZZZZ